MELTLISDQAKDLVKIVWKAGGVFLLFNCWFTFAILNKWTVSESRKFYVTISPVLSVDMLSVFLEVLWLSPVIYCDLPKVLTDQSQVCTCVVELVLPEYFVPA